MILTKKQIDELPFDTCEQLLDVLYIIEDQLNYKCKKVSATINYLQDELHPIKTEEELAEELFGVYNNCEYTPKEDEEA